MHLIAHRSGAWEYLASLGTDENKQNDDDSDDEDDAKGNSDGDRSDPRSSLCAGTIVDVRHGSKDDLKRRIIVDRVP